MADSDLNKYFMNEFKSDVIFIVNGKRIPAIKVVLSMKSDVFEAMFSGNFRESYDKEIEIKDTDFEAFKAMIGFLYNNKVVINPINWSNNHSMAIKVYKCGHKYQIKELMDCIEEKMIQMIGFDNIEDIYEFATNYKTENLMKALNEFIDNHMKEYLTQRVTQLKRLNTFSDNYLLEKIIAKQNTEISELNRKMGITMRVYTKIRSFFTQGDFNDSDNYGLQTKDDLGKTRYVNLYRTKNKEFRQYGYDYAYTVYRSQD